MTNNHSKGRAIALLPIAVFLLFFIGSGLITGDFYSMPAIVGFLIALIIAFLQNKKLSFVQKLRLASTGVGDENILTMCLIFLLAGAFTGAATAAGGVDSTVNLGLTLLPGGLAVVGLFVIGCFISTSMGTSVTLSISTMTVMGSTLVRASRVFSLSFSATARSFSRSFIDGSSRTA